MKNKRGVSEILLKFILYGILAFVMWLMVFKVAGCLFRLSDQAKESFLQLTTRIDEFDSQETVGTVEDAIPLYMDDKTVILGWSKGFDKMVYLNLVGLHSPTTFLQHVYFVERPLACDDARESACLCLCRKLKASFWKNEAECLKSYCRNYYNVDIFNSIPYLHTQFSIFDKLNLLFRSNVIKEEATKRGAGGFFVSRFDMKIDGLPRPEVPVLESPDGPLYDPKLEPSYSKRRLSELRLQYADGFVNLCWEELCFEDFGLIVKSPRDYAAINEIGKIRQKCSKTGEENIELEDMDGYCLVVKPKNEKDPTVYLMSDCSKATFKEMYLIGPITGVNVCELYNDDLTKIINPASVRIRNMDNECCLEV